MSKFLNNINLEAANDIQFKTTAGANAGKIEQDGNNLVLSNAVGDVLLGDGSSDVYIGDGTNNVDILFEQSGSIRGDGSAITLTIGGANTTLNLENPALSGNPTAPTQAANNNSTRIATTAYVQTELSDLIGSAPAALDTLNELAAAINDDSTFSSTVTTALGNRLRVDTASQGLNATQKSNARTNLGLGSAATSASSAFATASHTHANANSTSSGFMSDADYDKLEGIAANADVTPSWVPSTNPNYLTSLGTAIVDGDFTANGLMKRTGAGTYASITDNSSNWDTAYGWGNHASAGYNTIIGTDSDINTSGSTIIDNIFVTDGVITSMGTRTLTLANLGYTGATNANYITNNNQLTNGASYITGNQTITLSGDVSGSGTTSISVTVNDDSHNHTGLLKRADIGSSVNLNGYTTDGYYHQNGNAGASSGSNYPEAKAGMLTVQADGVMVYQKYQLYDGTGTYHRSYYNGTWYAWRRLFADNHHPNADTLTTARTISLGGDLSGSASFNGSSDITITAAVADDSHNHVISNVDGLQTALNAKAPLASPTFSGTPTAPTASANTNTTQIATTAYVQTEITDLIGSAPAALDTLNELAAAINDDSAFSSTVTTALGNRLRVDTASQGLSSTEQSNARTNLGLGSAATSNTSAFLGATAKAADSNLLDGLDLHTGRNNEANKVVRTDGNGYIQAGWINTTSGANTTQAINRVYASTDTYIRYYSAADFGAGIGQHISYNDLTNKPTIPSAYSLPLSSSSTRGGVKIGYSENGKNYPVEINSSEQMFVNVPWVDTNTNTTYSAGTGISLSGTTFSLTDTNAKLNLSGGTLTGDLVVEDSEIHVGDKSNDQWTRILHTSANGYGFSWQHTNATVLVNEQGNTNQVMVLGDVNASNSLSGLFGIAHSTNGGTSWTKKLDLRGDGDLYIGSSGTSKVFHDGYHPNADTLTTARTISLAGDVTGSVSFNGSSNVSITATVADDSHNHVISNVDGLQTALDGKLNTAGGTMTGNLQIATYSAVYNASYFSTSNASTRSKLRLYYTSTDYAIGMQSGVTYGGLGDWSMTFQFSNSNNRGFWWGDSAHTTAQGAMALTTQGKLSVARTVRVGYGETDTTTPSDSYADYNIPIKHRVYTASTLPSASPAGQKAFISDSAYGLATAIGAVVSGGGSNAIPVYSDGSSWRAG